ncbi:hypothetical protein PIECOFPK_01364 [Mycovorax composti]|uniref:DUF4292 domain-containing protein n=1 Tax=Mycovorax composti TaxID=2962693 RepID=A0ABZ2EK39_9BACT
MKKLLLIGVVALLASCKAGKKAASTIPAKNIDTAAMKAESPEVILSNLNHIDFKTFSGRVDVDFDDGKNARSVNVKLVMKKDEVIWMSAGLMGFEGVRGIITQDSVKIINKLQKEYIATSLNYIQEQIGLPVDFATIQDLLIGNAVFVNKDNASVSTEGEKYVITTQGAQFKNLLTVLMPGYLPTETKLTDVEASKKRSATIIYDRYKNVADRNFSTLRNMQVRYKNNVTLKMDFKSYTFDGEVSTPFSVPSGYKTKQ